MICLFVVKCFNNEFKIVLSFWLPNFNNFIIQQKLLVLRINGNKQTFGVSMKTENTLKCFLMYARSEGDLFELLSAPYVCLWAFECHAFFCLYSIWLKASGIFWETLFTEWGKVKEPSTWAMWSPYLFLVGGERKKVDQHLVPLL